MDFSVRARRSHRTSLGVVLGVAVATVVLTSTPSAVVAGGVGGDAIPITGLDLIPITGSETPSISGAEMSCAAPGECAASGYYTDADGYQGFVVTQTGGVWGDAEPVPGLKALNVGNNVGALSVSCAAPGECAASGFYKDAVGAQGFVVTQTGGVWGDAEPAPGLTALNVGNNAWTEEVSCAAPGECAASGFYKEDNDKVQGFVVTQTDRVWGVAQLVPGLKALNVGDEAYAGSVSCAAPGECSATGTYKDGNDGAQGFVVTQTGGVWGVAEPVPGLEDLNVGDEAYAGQVSCAAPGECSASGFYKDADGYQGYVVTQTDRVWGVAKPVPGLKALNVVEQIYPSFGSVSCAAPGECVATGTYKDADGYQGYVVTQTGGLWGVAKPVPGLKALNVGNDVGANAFAGSVSCAAPGACYATGSYTDADGHQQGFVVDVLSGYRPVAPTRVVDTRDNGGARRAAGSTLTVSVGAQYASQSISVNLAATDAVATGFATLFACDQDRPGTASLNFQAGEDISNGVITKVSAEGTVCVYVHQSTHLVLDVFGVFPSESAFAPVAPTRAVDTRDNGGARRAAGSTLTVSVGAQYASQSISVNLAATDAVATGFATLFACDQDRPGTASLNFQAGEDISNGVITKVSAEGTVCVYVHQSTHLVVDVFGVFAD